MDDEMFTIRFPGESMTAVRAEYAEGSCYKVTVAEGLSTDLALVLPVAAVVVVDKVVWSSAQRADNIFRYRLGLLYLHR